jgi:hypothetical protein
MNRSSLVVACALLAAVTLLAGCKKKKPLYAEIPWGTASGRAGALLFFQGSATHPDGDDVAIRFDWGDGGTSLWTDWLASGETLLLSHRWSAANTYSVRTQAKDTAGTLSDWSDPFNVTIVNVWTQTLGGTADDEGYAVVQSANGGYFVAGTTFSFGSGAGDIYLVKTDASGAQDWAKTIGGTGYDAANSVLPTSDGGCVLAGTTYLDALNRSDVYLAKIDASGTVVFARNFGWIGADMGRSVAQTSDGGYIVAGQTGSFGAGGYDVYLIKTDAAGSKLWDQVFGGAYDDIGYSVQQTEDGGYIIAGSTDLSGSGVPDIYLIKTDTGGKQVWAKTFDLGGHDYGYSVQNTTDGGYVIAGQTEGGGGGSYAYLLKTDADGNKVWDKTYGANGGEFARSIQRTGDGGYVVAGATASVGAGAYDVYLLKTDASGDTLWTRTFGGPESDIGYSVQAAADGGYIVSGSTISYGAGERDVWLIKTDAQGNVTP